MLSIALSLHYSFAKRFSEATGFLVLGLCQLSHKTQHSPHDGSGRIEACAKGSHVRASSSRAAHAVCGCATNRAGTSAGTDEAGSASRTAGNGSATGAVTGAVACGTVIRDRGAVVAQTQEIPMDNTVSALGDGCVLGKIFAVQRNVGDTANCNRASNAL
jgi:hypothetical protein